MDSEEESFCEHSSASEFQLVFRSSDEVRLLNFSLFLSLVCSNFLSLEA